MEKPNRDKDRKTTRETDRPNDGQTDRQTGAWDKSERFEKE